MGNGVISEDQLAEKLVRAKKLMDKSGDTKPSRRAPAIREQQVNFNMDDYNLMEETEYLPDEVPPMAQPNVNVSKISQSRLPDAIKQAMIDHPISLNENMSLDVTQKAKLLMERDGTISKPAVKKTSATQMDSNSLVRMLTPIIENVVRKTLDDIVDKKLTQIIKAQEIATINENLIIQVGDSMFRGKITGVKKK
jgi:hypothetical protein